MDKLSLLKYEISSRRSFAVLLEWNAPSALVALLSKKLGRNTVAITVSTSRSRQSEVAAAKKFAEKHGVEHVVVPLEEIDTPECSEEFIRSLAYAAAFEVSGRRGLRLADGRCALEQPVHGAYSPLSITGISPADASALCKRLGFSAPAKKSRAIRSAKNPQLKNVFHSVHDKPKPARRSSVIVPSLKRGVRGVYKVERRQ